MAAMPFKSITLKLFAVLYLVSMSSSGQIVVTSPVATALRNRLEASGTPRQLTVGDQLIYSPDQVFRFYEERGFMPLWSDTAVLTARLIAALASADKEGLRPQDYHLSLLQGIESQRTQNDAQSNPRLLVDLEITATDAFLTYASHLLSGRVNPVTFDPEWIARPRELDLVAILEEAVSKKEVDVVLDQLLPHHEGYSILKRARQRLLATKRAGGWKEVPEGTKLERGMVNERIPFLRGRLLVSGDLSSNGSSERQLFDDDLSEAVKSFQEKHGLEADGVVGPKTLEALNTSVERRVQQIELNMERWRWLPQDLGARYILVNIAGFELEVVEQENAIISMAVVVGRPYRRTPVFSDRMTYLVFSPYWQVPPNLASQDIVPKARQDPAYLETEGFKVFRGWGADSREIPLSEIDWTSLSREEARGLRFRQEPGPRNALGRVKFMFPNPYNVYLHDTPTRGLFAKAERAFSSGCIRVEKPLELAGYLLRDSPGWTPDRIATAASAGAEQTVSLASAIPVHLLYWTAWADDAGRIHFRNDIYGRDSSLLKALEERAPQPEAG